MIYIKTDWTIPFYNMALEQHVITTFPDDEDYLFFYRHVPSVIVGRHQNTIEEINLEYAQAHRIYVARRLSGGGAVYHDMGNLNYSIVTKKQDCSRYDFESLTRPVLDTLRDMGVDASLSGRNDLTIGGRKFSGAAQYSCGGRLLHHGTLLFDSDLDCLEKALQVKPMKIESKAIRSVRSRVTNIREHLAGAASIEDFRLRLLVRLINDRNAAEYELSEEDKAAIEGKVREKFSTWAWNWGESPACTFQKTEKFDCGIVDLRLDIASGRIRSLCIFGDFFTLKDLDGLTEALTGLEYRPDALNSAVTRLNVPDYISGLTNRELMLLLYP